MSNKNIYNQYYTLKEVSNHCVNILKTKLNKYIDETDIFLEPSAGNGSFIDTIKTNFPNNKILSYDIDPKRNDIRVADFLNVNLDKYRNLITVGNPPFGKKSKLALEFYNKSMRHSKIVAFIVPVQFNKWLTQRKIDSKFKLIYSELLDPESFVFGNRTYKVRSVYQIWTRDDFGFDNLRMTKAPPLKHKDFECWQYNITPSSLKYFDYEWDFAVVRQGYKDYTELIFDKKELNKSVQYMFFKAKDKKTLNNLLNIDFKMLSYLNTSTPGFGKRDLITHYIEKYENKLQQLV